MLSHKLLIKAGYISQLGAGIFSFTPIGWRVIEKIKNIIRYEMNSIDCHEANFPVIQPSDIWEESGRIDSFIPPLARFKDRRDKIMIIAPTHEESVISLVRSEVNSYRDMPFSLFHIQTKFRDETRPRGGLLRVREFEMKDAYSFHADQNDLDDIYEKFSNAYFNIFNKCGIDVIKVAADSGAIGGKVSSEFISVAESGEDTILKCDICSYAANEEKAEFKKISKTISNNSIEISEVKTPNIKSIKDLFLLSLLGILGGLANLWLTQSYKFSDVSLVTPLKYLALVFAIFFGYVIWDEVPSSKTLIGSLLVIISSIIIFRREISLKKEVSIPRHE